MQLYGDELRWVGTWARGLAWDGKRWTLDAEGRWQRAAVQTSRVEFERACVAFREATLGGDQEKIKRTKAGLDWAKQSQNATRLAAMQTLARSVPSIVITHDSLDTDPWLLNVANGTLDLRTGELRSHARNHLLTKLAPVEYDPKATCPRFEQFIREVMAGDEELVEFMRRHLGYCLSGDVREHVLTFWYGTGCNGKSVLSELMQYILGDYAAKAAPDLLFRSEKTDRHPTEIADLHGRRFVVCNETTRGRSWDEGTVKDVTGGDTIRARRMREDFWSFSPTHKLVVFGNVKPRIAHVDNAMRRRLRLVPFAVSFEGRRDTNLLQLLHAEACGVLRWLLEGCLAWQKQGLPNASAIEDATDSYLRDEDTLGRFFETECVFDPDAKICRKELRTAYVAWSQDRDEKPLGPKTLAEALRRKGVRDARVRTAEGPRDGWKGVRLAENRLAQPAKDGAQVEMSDVP